MIEHVPDEAWATVVRSVPIVSVDLVVRHEGRIALGKRENEPARGEWFVPGGRVHTNERLDDTVHRVAREECGIEVSIDRRLGVYEHLYDVADVPDAGGKHYVPVGYVVDAASDDLRTDDQHGAFEWFDPPVEFDLHPYVRDYLADAGMLEE
ncbi:MAG: NUDIX domain-containing protein [Halobacteriales archaeon]|nr:NUDIX domain-containing protein [Halobacteriales archaeon]